MKALKNCQSGLFSLLVIGESGVYRRTYLPTFLFIFLLPGLILEKRKGQKRDSQNRRKK
jgi:hypothetical protein